MESGGKHESLLRQYARITPDGCAGLLAVARRALPKAELQAFKQYLRPSGESEGITFQRLKTHWNRERARVLASAYRDLNEYCSVQRRKSSEPRYALIELAMLAMTSQSAGLPVHEASDPRGHILNCDLAEGLAFLTKGHERPVALRHNVLRIVGCLYEMPIREVTNRYSFDRTLSLVVDLYCLTEREIEGFAYSNHLPCGPKTTSYLNGLLASVKLPDIDGVLK